MKDKTMKTEFFAALVIIGAVFIYSVQAQTVTVKNDKTRSISPDFIGYNGNLTAVEKPWDNADMLALLKKLNARTLRYPGGTLGNAWDWEIGWIGQNIDDKNFVPWMREQKIQQSKRRYTLEDLAKMHRATGVKPVFMLNMVTATLEEQTAALKRAEKLGLPVEYVELGNELYFSEPLTVKAFPTPEDYGRASRVWIAALKKEFPRAKFAIVADEREIPASNVRRTNWNERVLSEVKTADAATIHIYSFGFADRSLRVQGNWGTAEQQAKFYEKFNEPGGTARFLAAAFHDAGELEKVKLPEGMEIWMTEWNLWDRVGANRGTWAHGLYAAAFLQTFLRDGRVNLSNYHNLVSDLFQAAFTRETEFEGLSVKTGKDLRSESYELSAAGRVNAMFGAAMNGMTRATEIEFAPNEPVKVENFPAYPSLAGWRFSAKNGNRETAILINFSGKPAEVDLKNAKLDRANYRQITASPSDFITGDKALPEKSGKAGKTLSLPAYSVTVVEK